MFAESVMVLRQRGNEHNGFSSRFVASLPGSLLLCLQLLHSLRTQKIPVMVYFEDEKIRDDEQVWEPTGFPLVDSKHRLSPFTSSDT